ncbi:MAG: DMT family transporter [Microbacteriaceae bacterium]|nr:DMT family transporter [Microbacteriaceae bacterium]
MNALSIPIQLPQGQWAGIPFAILGAVAMSLGAQFQHRGVSKVGGDTDTLNLGQVGGLLKRPSWLLGTFLLGLAIVMQLVSLGLSPLIVVQPVGAIALVFTTFLNWKMNGTKPTKQTLTAVTACLVGVSGFVLITAFYAVNNPITDEKLLAVVIVLLVILIATGIAYVLYRERMRAFSYVVVAAVLYGFVAILAKVVLSQISFGLVTWLTLTALGGLVIALLLGSYFVQLAYASGPPDLVIAGLTVIDPIIAVLIAIIIFQEALSMPSYASALLVIFGAIAVIGVWLLSKTHPEVALRKSRALDNIE